MYFVYLYNHSCVNSYTPAAITLFSPLFAEERPWQEPTEDVPLQIQKTQSQWRSKVIEPLGGNDVTSSNMAIKA